MKVKHQLTFETEFDESNPLTLQVKLMPESVIKKMLEDMLKQLVVPELEPVLEELNKNGSWAILKVVK